MSIAFVSLPIEPWHAAMSHHLVAIDSTALPPLSNKWKGKTTAPAVRCFASFEREARSRFGLEDGFLIKLIQKNLLTGPGKRALGQQAGCVLALR